MDSVSSSDSHRSEIDQRERFAFGANWARFLTVLNEERIQGAVDSLKSMLGVESLSGLSFLDVGSGSGLFSLAARRLGAKVHSFDYDPQSVACTAELQRRYSQGDPDWQVQQGSVLDQAYLNALGQFDVVYSWGVLHHTGVMWKALENVDRLVAPKGRLFIALYNDQGSASKYWTMVKKAYNRHPTTRPFWIAVHGLYPTLPSAMLKVLRGQKYPRGMNPWYDLLDWLGGYPFEVSRPAPITSFFTSRGYELVKLKDVRGKLGCNEYVFRRT